MARELMVAFRCRVGRRWSPTRHALVDTGAANAVLPGVRGGLVTCRSAFADIAGDRLWGDVRRVEVQLLGTGSALIEAFVPRGTDPRPSNRRDGGWPPRLGSLQRRHVPILGHRFLEAIGGVLRFGKNEGVHCDPRNADPTVTQFVTESATMRFGIVATKTGSARR